MTQERDALLARDTDALLVKLLADQSVADIVAALGLDVATATRVRNAAYAKLPLRYWYIHAGPTENMPDDDYDLIVVARTKEEADALWRKHYNIDEDGPDVIWLAPLPPLDEFDGPSAINWHTIRQGGGE